MKNTISIHVQPIPYARMTRFSKWNKQAKKYTQYKQFIQLMVKKEKFEPSNRLLINFYIPMAKSWTKKKLKKMLYSPHQQKPDLDNYVKAVLDSLFYDRGGDHAVSEIRATKNWHDQGCIEISNLDTTGGSNE